MFNSTGNRRGKPWSHQEIEACISAYLEMLRAEHRGSRYTKTETVRRLADLLPGRSTASIERKFQNVSAVLIELGQPWIDGYKPLAHYQGDLRVALTHRLRQDHRLAESLANYAATPLHAPQPDDIATDDVLVAPPGTKQRDGAYSSVRLTGGPVSALRDYKSKSLGDAGEAWVADLERERLRRLGRDDLSGRVAWAAREIGDGLGYDVASFWPDGRDRFIEVKTTNYGIRTPFYITRWEVGFSARSANNYSLYRVHGFARDPRLYILDGAVETTARLVPSVFLGEPL